MNVPEPLLIDILRQLQQIQHSQQALSAELHALRQHCQALQDVQSRALQSADARFKSLSGMTRHLQRLILAVRPLPVTVEDPPPPPVTLAVAAVACNEGPYLREWLEYHKLVGVERFYFYDNGSTGNTREIVEPYIQDGTLVYTYFPGFGVQIAAFGDALARHRFEAKWLAHIDLDEFMVPLQHDTVTAFLAYFEQQHMARQMHGFCPGVAMNWLNFDSNGHETRPTAQGGLVTANYTRVRRDHDHAATDKNDRIVKCIVNPRAVYSQSVHHCIFANRRPALNENGEPVWGDATSVHSTRLIQLNHYHCKSRQEYLSKMQRNAAGHGQTICNTFMEDNLVFPGPTEQNLAIQRFLPALRAALGMTC